MDENTLHCRCVFDFDFDISDFDPTCIDIKGLAKDTVAREIESVIKDEGYADFGENYVEILTNVPTFTPLTYAILDFLDKNAYKYIVRLDDRTLYGCRWDVKDKLEVLENKNEDDSIELPIEYLDWIFLKYLKNGEIYSVSELINKD